jgi:hypothetical protein
MSQWNIPIGGWLHFGLEKLSPFYLRASMTDPNDLERIDQEIRINELREAVVEVTGENFLSYENPDSPPELVEQFWRHVLDF